MSISEWQAGQDGQKRQWSLDMAGPPPCGEVQHEGLVGDIELAGLATSVHKPLVHDRRGTAVYAVRWDVPPAFHLPPSVRSQI